MQRAGQAKVSEYTIRQYEPGDKEDVVAVHNTGLSTATPELYEWEFESNPYLDHTPIFVAEYDGEIVGSRPYFVLKMAVEDEEFIAIQFAATAVHPDHRKQGLLHRMTEKSLEYYQNVAEVEVGFVSPGSVPWNTYSKLGFEMVDEGFPHLFRFQNPGAVGSVASNPLLRAGTKAASPFYRQYRRLADQRTIDLPDGITIEHHSEPPIEDLVSLYESEPRPQKIHTVRDAEYFDWRYGSPQYNYTFHLVKESGEVTSAIITASESEWLKGVTTTRVVDALPLSIWETPDRFIDILGAVIQRDRGTDLYHIPCPVIDVKYYKRLGFIPSDQFPVSEFLDNSGRLAVFRPSDDTDINGVDCMDASNWHLPACDFNPY